MRTCDDFRDRMSACIEGELETSEQDLLLRHLESCLECAETLAAMELLSADGGILKDLEPPPALRATLKHNPCDRWLALLFSAIDREIDDANLERLLGHFQECETCNNVWSDMTLVRRLSTSITPPQGLQKRCTVFQRVRQSMPVIGKRTAIAAAYVLAVLTSLVIGNPVILARNPAAISVRNAINNVSTGVEIIASDSGGEIRVLLWRAWQWGADQARKLKLTLDDINDDDDSNVEQGEHS